MMQEAEAKGLFAKLCMLAELALDPGPPLHDCLFVAQAGGTEETRAALEQAARAATGAGHVKMKPVLLIS